MKQSIVAFLCAFLFLAFTPLNAEAKDHHKKRHHDRGHDRDRHHYSYSHDRHHYDHDRGHHYGHQRTSYRPGHYTWVHHRRVWVPAATVVVYY